jgi:signal transduction histidine kinase/CheY-like chemotaxis protein
LPVPALAPSIGIDSGSSGADNSDKAEPVATSPAGLDDLVSGAQRLIVALSTVGCFMVLVLVILLVRFLRALLRKRKLAAIQLLDQSRAEAASEARSRLIRTVMHDLRSPLMAVSNTVHALLAMPAPRPSLDATKPQLEAMKDCAHLMEGIISDMLGAWRARVFARAGRTRAFTPRRACASHNLLLTSRRTCRPSRSARPADFERIEAGRLTLVAVPFYAADLVRVTRSTFDSNAAKRNVRFECTEPEGPLGGCELLGDARRLQQCVNNGVSNALKFTSEGGLVRVRMRVGELAAADRALLCVEVIDDGVGLSVEELALLNEDIPFTQVGLGQMQGNGGTGLGLSIVRQMLKLHTGSSLELQSAGHGEGVTYRLNVNCSRAQSNLTRQPSDRMLAMAARVALLTPSSLRGGLVLSRSSAAGFSELASETLEEVPFPAGYRVLHVDDDAFVRMTLPLTTFVTLGVEFRQAVHGGEALRLLQAGERFDFFVVDSQMPMMCGGPFTRELRALGFSGPVVGMTGDPAGGEDRREFESSGLTACFDKDMTGVAALIDEMRKHARYLYDHHGALDRQWPPLQHASTRPAILRVSSGVRSGGSGQHSGAQSYTQSSRQRVVPSNVSNGIVGFKQRAIDDSPTRTLDANSPAPPGRTGGRTRTHPVSSSSDETLCIASAGHLVTTL